MADITPEIGSVPLKPPDEKVDSSNKTDVYGYIKQDLAVKIKNPKKTTGFTSVEEAVGQIAQSEIDRQKVKGILEELGSTEKNIPKTSAIIHRDLQDKITYIETQQWYKNAKTLRKEGKELFKLPRDSLFDLRNIFLTNIKLWKTEGRSLDLVGSTSSGVAKPLKVIRHILPLFFSENILIDSQQVPRFVDMGIFDKKIKQGFMASLRQYLQLFGSYISVGIINFALMVHREEKERINIISLGENLRKP